MSTDRFTRPAGQSTSAEHTQKLMRQQQIEFDSMRKEFEYMRDAFFHLVENQNRLLGEEWLTVAQFAELYQPRHQDSTIRRWCVEGRLPADNATGTWRIPRWAVGYEVISGEVAARAMGIGLDELAHRCQAWQLRWDNSGKPWFLQPHEEKNYNWPARYAFRERALRNTGIPGNFDSDSDTSPTHSTTK